MPSWFDLMSLDPAGPEDEAGIKAAAKMVRHHVFGIKYKLISIGGLPDSGRDQVWYPCLPHPSGWV